MVVSGISFNHGTPSRRLLSNGIAINLPTSQSSKEYAKVPYYLPSYTAFLWTSCWTTSGHGAKVGEVYMDELQSPDELQAMLNIVSSYATRWRYQLNPEKSAVMVFGESSRSISTGRLNRKWYLSNSLIHETDHQHHLGIIRSVLNSTIQRTNERCSCSVPFRSVP